MSATIAVIFVVVMLIAMHVESQRRLRLTPPPAKAEPKPVPAALKAELDQTPEWWERQFHQLLAAVAAPAAVDDVIEIRDYSGRTLVYDEIKGWRDCTCPSCRRICR